VVKRLAMARPDVGFVLEHDGRRVLAVQPGETAPQRVARIVARELADDGVVIDLERGDVRLTGVAGLPTFNRGVADHQYLFVNGRPVRTSCWWARCAGPMPTCWRATAMRCWRCSSTCRRGCRRERPSGQDRGAFPRSCLCARLYRFGSAPCAGGRRAEIGPDPAAPAMASWQVEPIAPVQPRLESLFARQYAPTPGFTPPANRVSEAGAAWRGYEAQVMAPPAQPALMGRAEVAEAPVPKPWSIRWGWRVVRWRKPISSPRPAMVW
jgi:DNA mismatch repair protein MutL